MSEKERLEARIRVLECRRERIDKRISALKGKLRKEETDAMLARLILVPFDRFVRLAQENEEAWRITDYNRDDNCYAAVRECVIIDDGCWFKRNTDRCEELHALYTLKDYEDVVLCNLCYPDKIEEAMEEHVDRGEQEIDPANYPKEAWDDY